MTEQPGDPEPSAEPPKSDDSAADADAADDDGIEYEQRALIQEESEDPDGPVPVTTEP